MYEEIKYSGLKSLDVNEQNTINKLVEREYPKIQRSVKEVTSFNIDIKVMKKDTKKRYMISMRLQTPGKLFTTENKDTERGGDWDLPKEIHKELKALIGEIEHYNKKQSGKWKKAGGIKSLFQKFKID